MRARQPRSRVSRSGFTLLEAMLALVIFGVITFALSLSIAASLQAQQVSERRHEESATIRAVFGSLTRDIQAAFPSLNSPVSLFLSGNTRGSASNSSVPVNAQLALTTLSNRIQAPTLEMQQNMSGANNVNPALQGTSALPQADCVLVRYDLNPQDGTLSRTVSPVPNLQGIVQPVNGPDTVLAQNIVDFQLRFWDIEQRNWRTDWDFEQQNQAQNPQGQSGSTGQQASSPSQTTGDASLPGAVEATLTLRRSDGMQATYTTMIPVLAPYPSKPVATVAPATNQQQPGIGGGNPGQNPGGQ